MQADAKVKLARDGIPVTRECAYLDCGSVGPVSSIFAETLAGCTAEDVGKGRALMQRFERIERAKLEIRSEIGLLLGTSPDCVELTQSTRDSIVALLERLTFEPDDEILTTSIEFPACIDAIRRLESTAGISVVAAVVPAEPSDDIEWLRRHVSARTRLIAVSGVAYATGWRMPIEAIASFAAEHGIACLVDGAQLVGAAALDLGDTEIDYLALPLQKWLCGPEGLGALITKSPSAQSGFRVVHGWPVLEATARHLEWMRESLTWDWIQRRTTELSAYAYDRMSSLPAGTRVTPSAHAGLVAVRCEPGVSGKHYERLLKEGIVVRHRPELDLIRISTAFFNHKDEIDRFVATLA